MYDKLHFRQENGYFMQKICEKHIFFFTSESGVWTVTIKV